VQQQPPEEFTTGLDDAELVRRATERDPIAFRTIMQRHNTRLYRIARGILRNDSEAEDVVQESYIRAFTHLATFRGEASLGTWLARIVMNEALGRRRREPPTVEWTTMETDATGNENSLLRQAAFGASPERTIAQQEIQRLVEAAIDDLPEKYRMVLLTRAVEGMSVEETASLLSLTTETVRTQLHRARSLLRVALEKQIGPLVLGAFPFAGARCERLTEAVLRRLHLA